MLIFFLFEYPLYKAHIEKKGLGTVSLGNQHSGYYLNGLALINPDTIELAADKVFKILNNCGHRNEIVEHNYNVGKKHFSMYALSTDLAQRLQHLYI
jgi:hypothetical protein